MNSTHVLEYCVLYNAYLLGYEFPKYSNPTGVMLNAMFLSENDIKTNTGIQVQFPTGEYFDITYVIATSTRKEIYS